MDENTKLDETNILQFVLNSLQRNTVTETYPILQANFPDFDPSYLFRTLVIQQCWVHVCNNQLSDATRLLEGLGENPGKHFYEMWRQTTRNRVRSILYDYLHKQSLLSAKDEKCHQILLKITNKYPNTSFTKAMQLNKSPLVKVMQETSELPLWEPIVDLTLDFCEKRSMIFPDLFKLPEEQVVESPKYFLGNIALIEAQTPKMLKLLAGEGSNVDKLWIMHCEHKVMEMSQFFKEELDKNKDQKKKLKCLKFVNKYYKQLNEYEQETLLNILCENGYFADEEINDFQKLLIRICKNKFLFDQAWWGKTTLSFTKFFKGYASYCAEKNLFLPFEMFVVSHPKSKEIDISDVKEPLIHFIWDLWVKRDLSAASQSCMQFIGGSDSTDPIKLWDTLPKDSIAPLASLIWNKDPNKFKQGSVEINALSERLKDNYPLLSSLVKGEIPHPETPKVEVPKSKWRSPIYTSKYDLELHDLIASHFNQFDFSKVFTDYYGKTPGQPPFPHFDHPELITSPSEPPYVHYVKSMLPVSAFQQALEDGVIEPQFKDLCFHCMREALTNKAIRLAVLTFIELVDLKFDSDAAIDYKLSISIYDQLAKDNKTNNDILIEELSKIYVQKSQISAKSVQKKLEGNDIELFLLSVLLGVRCNLPLDYTPISTFARQNKPAQLLLFIDRAEEIGAFYPINDVVQIIKDDMPNNPLKDHLIFHLTQTLPTEESTPSSDIQPALVVFRAVRRTDQPQYISLLQEALNRKEKLYSILASSIYGADQEICAFVTLLTMTESYPFDIINPPEKSQISKSFLQVCMKLLLENRSSEVLKSLELFSEKSIITNLSNWYNSVETFAFKKAQIALDKINSSLTETINDELLGTINIKDIKQIIYPLQDSLAKICAQKSQVHLFRYLQLLANTDVSPMLELRVKLSKIIEKFDNFRKAIMKTDLLGDPEKIVSDLVLYQSLDLGQKAAECLGVSTASATDQWLKYQYSTATSVEQLLSTHQKISSTISNVDPFFFIYLFAKLLPYSQPYDIKAILQFALNNFKEENDLSPSIRALLLHLNICNENHKKVPEDRGFISRTNDILSVLFPYYDKITTIHFNLSLSIDSPILYSANSLQRFFDSTIEFTINDCLNNLRISDARQLCKWRNQNSTSILLFEAIQNIFDGINLNKEQEYIVQKYGSVDDVEKLLESISLQNDSRFKLIYLHYKASKIIGMSTINLLGKNTFDFLKSELPLNYDNWDLVKELISTSNLSNSEIAKALVESFISNDNNLLIDDFGEKFIEFSELCGDKNIFGEKLFEKAKEIKTDKSVQMVINILLHCSICSFGIDECAELINSFYNTLTQQNEIDLIIKIISTFQEPSLLPRYITYLITQEKIDLLDHEKMPSKIGLVIMNCAHHVHSFEPQKYFNLTLKYKLYREHAELRMEYGNSLLEGNPDPNTIKEASNQFLLALSYFLHEKCYCLSMECLKKLSLISLQQEQEKTNILHLEKSKVIELMETNDFPIAITLAVSYDLDNEEIWAKVLFEQYIVKENNKFLEDFQYFRPITSNLCICMVDEYKLRTENENIKNRMKQFLKNINNLVERYKIAKSLQFNDIINSLMSSNPVVCEWCEKVLGY